MIDAILEFLFVALIVLVIAGIVAAYFYINDQSSNTGDDALHFPQTVGYNVIQRSKTGGWVNRGTNLSENSAWHLAERLRAEEDLTIQIKDTEGNLIATL